MTAKKGFNRGKKRKKRKRQHPKASILITSNIAKEGDPKKWVSEFKKYWRVFAGIVLFVTFGITIYTVWPKSDKEKFDEDYTIKGKIETPKISEPPKLLINTPNFKFDEKNDSFPKIRGIYISDLNKYASLYFDIGSNTYGFSPTQLKAGIDLDYNGGNNGCVSTNLTIATKDDRVFVSAVFKDIDSENEVGFMEFNHWTLYKVTFLDYHPDPDDRKFEVLDKKGNILFSIAFSIVKGSPSLKISGYFVDDKNAMVVNGVDRDGNSPNNQDHTLGYFDCYYKTDSNWKQKVVTAIKNIKSVF